MVFGHFIYWYSYTQSVLYKMSIYSIMQGSVALQTDTRFVQMHTI